MNAERLLKLIDEILALENQYSLQSALVSFHSAFQTVVSQPQNTAAQTQLSTSLDEFGKSARALFAALTPMQLRDILSIGGGRYFNPDMVSNIRDQISSNALSPSVAFKYVDDYMLARELFVGTLDGTKANLEYLRFKAETLEEGEAEIGFGVPRVLFSGHLGPFMKELGELDRIVKFFQEVEGEAGEEVQIRTISASDPLIVLGAGVLTIRALGKAVTWALNTYKSILEIKRLRNEAEATQYFGEEQLKMFGSAIDERIASSLDERLNEIFGAAKEKGRKAELRNGMSWAHKTILAKVERGMTIEIRFLQPPDGAAVEDKEEDAYNDLGEIIRSLDFPATQGRPVTQLEAPPPEADADK